MKDVMIGVPRLVMTNVIGWEHVGSGILGMSIEPPRTRKILRWTGSSLGFLGPVRLLNNDQKLKTCETGEDLRNSNFIVHAPVFFGTALRATTLNELPTANGSQGTN